MQAALLFQTQARRVKVRPEVRAALLPRQRRVLQPQAAPAVSAVRELLHMRAAWWVKIILRELSPVRLRQRTLRAQSPRQAPPEMPDNQEARAAALRRVPHIPAARAALRVRAVLAVPLMPAVLSGLTRE
jgi:hypothetical protein